MKRTNLDVLSAHYRIADYKELYTKVIALIDSQKIKPVKASGKNGKSPALYREYWIIEEKQGISEYIYELNYGIVPSISTDYYRAHIDQYIQDRQWVLLLNDYIKNNDFMTRMSENERRKRERLKTYEDALAFLLDAAHLLKPLMDMADKMSTQLICFSGLGGDSIYGRFDNIYVLNLVSSNLRGGMQYLRGEHLRGAEETIVSSQMEVIGQQRLVF